jgi:hypothetical protein
VAFFGGVLGAFLLAVVVILTYNQGTLNEGRRVIQSCRDFHHVRIENVVIACEAAQEQS